MFKKWARKYEHRAELWEFYAKICQGAKDPITGLSPVPEGWYWHISKPLRGFANRKLTLYAPDGVVVDKFISHGDDSLLWAASSLLTDRYRKTTNGKKNDTVVGYYPPKKI